MADFGRNKIIIQDAAGRVSEFDNLFRSILVQQTEHREIHEGDHYEICDFALGVNNAAEIELVITTPDTTEWSHFLFEVTGSSGVSVEIFEGSNTVVGGTPITPLNNNRNSVNTSNLTILQDPTTIVDGVQILGFVGGTNVRTGIIERTKESILKRDETYLFRITSLAANNNISYCCSWYEHVGE